MRTKNAKSQSEKPLPASGLEGSPASVETVEEINRLSIAMDAQGNVLWDRMRDKTKDQLKGILASPDTAKKLGVESPAPPPVEVFDPAWTGYILDSIGKIESFAASKMYKIDSDIADKVFSYSEKEKEKLAPPLAKVINKYAPIWMEQYKDEVALAFLFVTITAVKLQAATAMQKMKSEMNATSKVVTMPSAADLDAVASEQKVKESTSVQ